MQTYQLIDDTIKYNKGTIKTLADATTELNRLVAQIDGLERAVQQARTDRNSFQHEAAVAATQAVNYKEYIRKLERMLEGIR